MSVLSSSSRESRPPWPIDILGRLHDSALGAIYFAKSKYKTPDQAEGLSLIVKTIDILDQNIYAVAKKNRRSILRDYPASQVLYLNSSKREAYIWLDAWCNDWPDRADASVAKVAWLKDSIERDGATTLLRLNEYLNESLVGQVLTKHLEPRLLKHFIKTFGSWISDSTGYILQEYGGASLLKNMTNLSLDQFKSVYLQTLLCLAETQELLHFKHHDVHLDNVFINHCDQETYEYTTSKGKFAIKNHGLLVKLGDFGLASITDPELKTRFERVDYEELNAGEIDWGRWCGTLENQWSYDAVTFMCKFFLHDESSVCPHTAWARSVFVQMKEKWPVIECSIHGRPFKNCEGPAKIAEILELPIFDEFRLSKM